MTKTKNNKIGRAEKTSSFSSRSLQLIKNNREKLHSIINRLLIVAICVSCVAYVVTINDLSIKGFVLNDKKNEIAELEVANEQFELEAMALESFELINERAKKLGMVKVDDIQYVSVVNGAVAVRD